MMAKSSHLAEAVMDQAGGQGLYKGQRGGHTLGLALPLAQGLTSVGPAPRKLGSPHGFMPRSIRQPSYCKAKPQSDPISCLASAKLGAVQDVFRQFRSRGSVCLAVYNVTTSRHIMSWSYTPINEDHGSLLLPQNHDMFYRQSEPSEPMSRKRRIRLLLSYLPDWYVTSHHPGFHLQLNSRTITIVLAYVFRDFLSEDPDSKILSQGHILLT